MSEDLVEAALKVLMPLEFYETTPEEFEKWRLQALAEVDGLCGGEAAIAATNFARVGAKGEKVSGFADGLAPYGLAGVARKGAALLGRKPGANLPKLLLLAVTEKRLIAFDAGYRYSVRRHKRETGRPVEVASWERSAVRVEVARPDPMTTLRIEPLDGGTVVHLAGPSVADDPWSLAVMALLDPSPTSRPAD